MSDQLADQLANRALELFSSKEMYCSEAILCALDEGLGGGLGREKARGLSMGFGQGIGHAGCICGALAGAVLSVSWFLSGRLKPDEVRAATRETHDRFKAAHGSSCCRVLTRKSEEKTGKRFTHCAGLTRYGAELAAGVILERLPDIAAAQQARPLRKHSRLASLLRRLADRLG